MRLPFFMMAHIVALGKWFSSRKKSDSFINKGGNGMGRSPRGHRGSINEDDSFSEDEDEDIDWVEHEFFVDQDGDEAGAVPGGRSKRKKAKRRRKRDKRGKKKKKKHRNTEEKTLRISLVMQQKAASGCREWITNLRIPADMTAGEFRVGVLEVL